MMGHFPGTGHLSIFSSSVVGFMIGVLFLLTVADAKAETSISLQTGGAWTHDSDVHLQAPGGTDLVYRDVSWDTKPFEMPPYYSLRVTHWFENQLDWGIAVDFTHAKMISDPNQSVIVSGQRAGAPVAGTERLGDSFDALEFSDGHNLFTINAVRRWRPFEDNGAGAFRKTAFYAGAGAGIAVPHVEVTIPGSTTREYQYAGPAVQFLGGASFPVGSRFELLTEYRLTYADLKTDLNGGGSLSTEALTHHLNFGVGFTFGQGRR